MDCYYQPSSPVLLDIHLTWGFSTGDPSNLSAGTQQAILQPIYTWLLFIYAVTFNWKWVVWGSKSLLGVWCLKKVEGPGNQYELLRYMLLSWYTLKTARELFNCFLEQSFPIPYIIVWELEKLDNIAAQRLTKLTYRWMNRETKKLLKRLLKTQWKKRWLRSSSRSLFLDPVLFELAHEGSLVCSSLEATMSKLGGCVNKLEVDLLQSHSLCVHQ